MIEPLRGGGHRTRIEAALSAHTTRTAKRAAATDAAALRDALAALVDELVREAVADVYREHRD